MKKITSLLTALALICTLTACSNSSNSSSDGGTALLTASQSAYKEDKLPVPEDFYSPKALIPTADGRLMFVYNDMYFADRAVLYDQQLNMGSSFGIEREEGEYLLSYALSDSGIKALSSRSADGGTVLSIKTYSMNGKVTATTELGDLDGHYDSNDNYFNNFSFHGEECLITFDKCAVIVDGDGNVTDYCDVDTGVTYAFDRDGGIICSFFKDATRLDKLRVPKESELSENPNGSSMLRPPVMGAERYSAYLILNDGVYGMDANGDKTLLLSFTVSNIKPSEIQAIVPFGEGKFVACTESELHLLTVRPDDYTDDRETVIVGMQNHVNTIDLDTATDFAKNVDGYQAEFREYEYGEDDLWKDILADDSPDVYIPYDHGEVIRSINLGAIADFGELHDKYGGISEDDFLPNIVSGMKYKGNLYSMGAHFRPNVHFANSDVLSREQAKWDYGEFFDFMETLPPDMYLAEHYVMDEPTDVFSWLCGKNCADWVDYEKAECCFDSPEFIRLLEFCKNVNCIGSYGTGYWENITQEQIALDATENMSMLGNKKVLFGGTVGGKDRFNSFVTSAAAHSMSLDELTVVLPPNSTRSGSFDIQDEFCVLTSGKCQQGGWEFVNYALSYDVQADQWSQWDYVTRKDAFDYILKAKFDNMNANENEVSSGVNGYQFTYKEEMTQEQFDYIKGVILSCDRLGTLDDKLSPILTEEFGSYIAGETPAEDCAKHIQNRVEIILSEQE